MHKRIYELSFFGGIMLMIYLYLFHFDDLSETELVRVSYLWVPAIIFGSHGLIAQAIHERKEADASMSTGDAMSAWMDSDCSFFERLAILFIPSYLGIQALFGGKNPLLLAIASALVWVGLLIFFFEAIFPSL